MQGKKSVLNSLVIFVFVFIMTCSHFFFILGIFEEDKTFQHNLFSGPGHSPGRAIAQPPAPALAPHLRYSFLRAYIFQPI